MIAKRVAMKSVKKSSFIALIGYLLGQQGKAERVGRVNVTNCRFSRSALGGDRSRGDAGAEYEG